MGERGQSYRVRQVCGCGGEGKTSLWVWRRGEDECGGVGERGQSYRVRRVCGCGGEGKTSV